MAKNRVKHVNTEGYSRGKKPLPISSLYSAFLERQRTLMQEAAGAEGLDVSEDAVYDALLSELPFVNVIPLRLAACT